MSYGRCLVLLLLLIPALPVSAQQDRWKQLTEQAVQLRRQGQYPRAAAAAGEAARVAEATFGAADLRYAASLDRLADLDNWAGNPADGEPLCRQALAMREKALGPDDPAVAQSLHTCASLDNSLGKFDEAEAFYQRALAIREKVLGPDSAEVAETLNWMALNYNSEAKLEEAEKAYQRALAIRRKLFGAESIEVAETLCFLGNLYGDLGRYVEEEDVERRALALREKLLPAGHADLAQSLNNLATAERVLGKLPEAESLYRRALAIDKSLSEDSPDYAAGLNNLGDLYWFQGKYAEAEQTYKLAVAVKEKASGPESADVAITLNNLAIVYREMGNYPAAEATIQRATAIDEKNLGKEHPRLAVDANESGLLYLLEGKYPQAEIQFQHAIAIWERSKGPDYDELAAVLGHLALVYQDQQRYAEAEPLLQRALRIDEKAFGPEHFAVAVDLNNLGALYYQEGKDDAAEPLFLRSLQLKQRVLGDGHRQVGATLENLARLYYARGDPGRASAFFDRSLLNLRQRFEQQFAYMSEKERLLFLGTASSAFPDYFSFCFHYRDQDPSLTGKMYDVLLWRKGFVASGVAALRTGIEASGDAQALALLQQLTSKKTQLANQVNSPTSDREAWRKQIEQLEAEANALEKALVARSAAFAQQKKLEHATWQQVRDALKPGEAAVEFARFQFFDGRKWTDTSYYVALVVTPESKAHPAYVVLGEAKALEGKSLVEYQQQVQARGMEAAPETGAAQPAAQAYELFWKPLQLLLAGKMRVYLSPDGVLNQLPLGLVPTPGGKLLMEKYDLRLLSSTKDLLRPAPPPATHTAVLIGNPAFGLSGPLYRAALGQLSAPPQPESVEMAMFAAADRSRDQGSGTTLPPLPGTGAEILAVSRLLQQHRWQATTYTGDRALEEAIKQVHSPRVLHVASHGFFLADQQIKTDKAGNENSGLEDPMLRSGLYFAGADRALAGAAPPDDLDDGVLTAYEATTLNLQGTELVVLSACNTGQGEVKNGEGVFGLRRALQEAGAQAVLMSLWPVPDKETQELMTLFYGKWLSGLEKHQALRQAQLAEREVVKQRYGRDLPYYWGAFVLVGR